MKSLGIWMLVLCCFTSFQISAQELAVIDSLQSAIDTASIDTIKVPEVVPNQGFSFTSLWRGALGMLVLVLIAFLFSANRRAINWKTVGIGLGLQLIIAVGVLKVRFVQVIFEWIGERFIDILEFTRAGSKFLFEGLVVDMDTFGYIFAFQVLPTIIFFSALTSVLFYLGIIQKVYVTGICCFYCYD